MRFCDVVGPQPAGHPRGDHNGVVGGAILPAAPAHFRYHLRERLRRGRGGLGPEVAGNNGRRALGSPLVAQAVEQPRRGERPGGEVEYEGSLQLCL